MRFLFFISVSKPPLSVNSSCLAPPGHAEPSLAPPRLPCLAQPRHATPHLPRHATPRRALSAVPSPALPSPAVSAMPRPAQPCRAPPCLPRHAMSRQDSPILAMPRLVCHVYGSSISYVSGHRFAVYRFASVRPSRSATIAETDLPYFR